MQDIIIIIGLICAILLMSAGINIIFCEISSNYKKGKESRWRLMDDARNNFKEKQKIIEMWEELGLTPDEVKALMLKYEKLIAANTKKEEEPTKLSSRIKDKKMDILQSENVRLMREISTLMNMLQESKEKNIKMLQKIQLQNEKFDELKNKYNILSDTKTISNPSRVINIYRGLLKRIYKNSYIEEKVCEGCLYDDTIPVPGACMNCDDGCCYEEVKTKDSE